MPKQVVLGIIRMDQVALEQHTPEQLNALKIRPRERFAVHLDILEQRSRDFTLPQKGHEQAILLDSERLGHREALRMHPLEVSELFLGPKLDQFSRIRAVVPFPESMLSVDVDLSIPENHGLHLVDLDRAVPLELLALDREIHIRLLTGGNAALDLRVVAVFLPTGELTLGSGVDNLLYNAVVLLVLPLDPLGVLLMDHPLDLILDLVAAPHPADVVVLGLADGLLHYVDAEVLILPVLLLVLIVVLLVGVPDFE